MAKDIVPFGDVAGAIRVHVPIDDPWRASCRKRLREMGQGQAELAAHIGCKQSNVSQTIGKEAKQARSRFAHAIALALGVPLPPPGRIAVLMEQIKVRVPDAFDEVTSALESLMGVPVVKPRNSGT